MRVIEQTAGDDKDKETLYFTDLFGFSSGGYGVVACSLVLSLSLPFLYMLMKLVWGQTINLTTGTTSYERFSYSASDPDEELRRTQILSDMLLPSNGPSQRMTRLSLNDSP